MPIFETIICSRSFHRVRVEADNKEEAIEKFQTDWDEFTLDEELYERSSWDIDDLDNIKNIK